MTNGEKIKATFPHYDIEIDEHKGYVRIFYENFYTTYPWGWWNSEYQEPTTKNDAPDINVGKIGSTTKNDLGVELISKEQTIDRVLTYFNHIDKGNDDEWVKGYEAGEEDAIAVIESMPSVPPQEPQSFKWCTDCKEYDQEKHCCHRYSKVIRDTVAEIEQEPKIGHWIEHPHEAGPNWEYSRYECSECHDWAEDDSDYCPDCGAKMIEPQESEK